MARRSLGKLDASVDVSKHLLTLETPPVPLDFARIFEREAPLELEIGSGKGMFLREISKAYPERNFLGVEIGQKYAKFCAIALARQDRQNARVISGDAVAVLNDYIDDATLLAVHVYFPDPWWKRAHRKRRVLREETLRLIERRLQPGGELHFRTDVREYFDATLKLLKEVTLLHGPFGVPESAAADCRTHFERRTVLHGEPVYRAIFRKMEDWFDNREKHR